MTDIIYQRRCTMHDYCDWVEIDRNLYEKGLADPCSQTFRKLIVIEAQQGRTQCRFCNFWDDKHVSHCPVRKLHEDATALGLELIVLGANSEKPSP